MRIWKWPELDIWMDIIWHTYVQSNRPEANRSGARNKNIHRKIWNKCEQNAKKTFSKMCIFEKFNSKNSKTIKRMQNTSPLLRWKLAGGWEVRTHRNIRLEVWRGVLMGILELFFQEFVPKGQPWAGKGGGHFQDGENHKCVFSCVFDFGKFAFLPFLPFVLRFSLFFSPRLFLDFCWKSFWL